MLSFLLVIMLEINVEYKLLEHNKEFDNYL